MPQGPAPPVITSPSGRETVRAATRPGRKVQLALDTQTLPLALGALQETADLIDVIEVGTVLCLSEGMAAVRAIRAAYPQHVVLADIRVAEAGALLSRLAFEAGADWVTVVSGASPGSFRAVADVSAEFGADVQVELSDGWTWDLVDRCRALGIAHFVLHRSRDAEAYGEVGWPETDLEAIARIHDMGGRVTVTGGMTVDQIDSFSALPVEIFIAGRAIYAADDARFAATRLRAAVDDLPALRETGR